MKTKSIAACLAVVALLVTGVAHADDNSASHWYLGASVGSSSFGNSDDDANTLSQELAGVGLPNTTSGKDNDTGYNISAGYSFNRYAALEAGYWDMGKAKFDVTFLPPFTGATASASIGMTGVSFEVVGSYPFTDNLSGFGRLGIIAASVKEDVSVNAPGVVVNNSQTGNSTSATYGLGLQYKFTPRVGGRFGWQHFANVGDSSTTGTGSVNYTYIGLVFSFGG